MRSPLNMLYVGLACLLASAAGVLGNAPKLINGSMNDGVAFPTGWSPVKADADSKGNIIATRDTQIFVEKPASLRLDAQNGTAGGQVSQTLSVSPGQTLTFSGQIKHETDDFGSQAIVALIVFDVNWKPVISWKELGRIQGAGDWQPFSTTVQMPDTAAHALLMLYYKGTGKAWYDEINVVEGTGKTTTPDGKTAPAAVPATRVLYSFKHSAGFTFTFNDFEKKDVIRPGPDYLTIHGTDRGGAGIVRTIDLRGYENGMLLVKASLSDKHNSYAIKVALQDDAGSSIAFSYTTFGNPDAENIPHNQIITLYPDGYASISKPNEMKLKEGQAAFDYQHVKQIIITGGWQGRQMDMQLAAFTLMRDTPPEMLEKRAVAEKEREERAQRNAERKQRQAEAEARRRENLLTEGAPHPVDGPKIENVGAVAPDILGVEIQSGEYEPGAMVPYEAQADDQQVDGRKAWIVRAGKLVEETIEPTVQRKDDQGREVKIGVLSFDGKWLLKNGRITGQALDLSVIEEPEAYEIQSNDDPAYAQRITPKAVYRKSKPNSPGAHGGIAISHRLYLKLPTPLKEGASYTVYLKGLNTRTASIIYKHDTLADRSEAVHVTQVGYRPDDPFKRGYLSAWIGTGGACQYSNISIFELVDAQTGRQVFTGHTELAPTQNAAVDMKKDYSQAPVYWLDFSDFDTPGTYRIHVPGIGFSYPFTIAGNAWESAFKISMRGILSQRTGIALGAPVLDFERPRPSHPDDGVKFYQIDIDRTAGQEGARGKALLRLWQTQGKLDEVTGIWGGYQDAGDWDTYTTTLATANMLTEAFEISPQYGSQLKLSLPSAENTNAIPDLLDEALWGLAAFKRLQLPSGAVRDGYGDGWGARPGDVSWNDSNPVCVYAASTATSWYYAFIAARMARVLKPYDAVQAEEYADSAVRAWQWAEAQSKAADAATDAAHRQDDRRWLRAHAKEAAAAVALYQLTRDPMYHERFKQICEILNPVDTNYKGGWIEPLQQEDATFYYARLPDELADPALKANALQRYILAGNIAVMYMRGNPYNLATVNPGFPMGEFCAYFTNPGMGTQIVRAHALTGDIRYLRAVVASTGFGLGANPENVVFTTGIGLNPVRFPLKLDNFRTGQPAPAGITVYGPSDQRTPSNMSNWVYQWILTSTRMVPNARTWPPAESYADIFVWPGANEYTVNSPLAVTAYTWCYLAARQ